MNAIEHHLPHADIYIIRQYVEDRTQLFEDLIKNLNLMKGSRSLSSAAYCNMGTDYLASNGKIRLGNKLDPLILRLMTRLNNELSVMMNSCFAMLYETEHAELPYREHSAISLDSDQPIITIFLGAPSKVFFKDITSAEEFDVELFAGDILIMPDLCQRHYFNAIKKSEGAFSPRLLLTFRRFNDGVFY
jgi:alkylated DNA repair dioxygenase AlkB